MIGGRRGRVRQYDNAPEARKIVLKSVASCKQIFPFVEQKKRKLIGTKEGWIE